MNNWATDKQIKFIRSLILKYGTINQLNYATLDFGFKIYSINANNKSLLNGGVYFEDASRIIDALLKNDFVLILKGDK